MKLKLIGQLMVGALIAALVAFIGTVFLPLVRYLEPDGQWRFGVFILPIAVLGYWFTVPRLSTHASRRCGVLFLVSFSIAMLLASETTAEYAFIPLVLAPAVYAYFLPAGLPMLLPMGFIILVVWLLASEVVFVAGALILVTTVAGAMFPLHRRMIEMWRPSHLPRLRRRRAGQGGVTLIELLIVVAILSIMAVGFHDLIGASAAAELRNTEHAEALAAAEDEIALLRAGAELPEAGTHPIDARVAAANAGAGRGDVSVEAGPDAALRVVRVRVPVGEPVRHEIRLAVILPAKRGVQDGNGGAK